jgi:CCR4-NOT transcription complex subunit 1
MEVFSKYFRRVLQNNAAQVFGTGTRAADANGSYQILTTELQKLRTEPEQADRIAESIDSSEGDVFRDFDLAAFVAHFKLDPFAKMALALACRKTELRQKGRRRVCCPIVHANSTQPTPSPPPSAKSCSWPSRDRPRRTT